MIKPPGEPREQHLGESSSYTKFHKNEMTIRVDILWRIFGNSVKKFKMKSQDRKTSFFLVNLTENFQKIYIFGSRDLNFLKNVADYIHPSGHLVFYDIFCGSNFYNKSIGIFE